MTGRAQLAGGEGDLGRCFEVFKASAFRLETLRAYAVPAEGEHLRAFRLGLPRPERSVRTSSWLRLIAETTAAGKSWRRVRVVGRPLSEYECYQLIGYRESAKAGEVTRIADRSAHPELATLTRDFWLFDDRELFDMAYASDGTWLGAEHVTDPAAVTRACRARDTALHLAQPWADFVQERPELRVSA